KQRGQVHLFALTPSADTAEQQQRDKMKQAGVTETGVRKQGSVCTFRQRNRRNEKQGSVWTFRRTSEAGTDRRSFGRAASSIGPFRVRSPDAPPTETRLGRCASAHRAAGQ